ncbi:cation:proton antiporter domain-containing protein [Pontibacter mangrovi]|uniref:cation:proton antiporter domain-containing protein n=1 Tax=Pontibacter mangrovi TaxID=2589816 RepID=UPI001C611F6A|nr:cation:proton antiporter [Pontibacter mangrovi]
MIGKDDLNVIVTVLGCLVLLLALVSKKQEKSPIPATLLALLFGILIGPAFLGIIDLTELGDKSTILESAAHLVLGVGLVGVALRIPTAYLRQNWRQMAILVGGSMVLMWVISTMLIYFVLGTSFWLSALLGAIITPTDPIAASPIVTGSVAKKNLPKDKACNLL